MSPRNAARLAATAGRCTVVLFVASLVSCAFGGAGRGGNLAAVLFGFLLALLALAALVVWVTARDVAGDEPPDHKN